MKIENEIIKVLEHPNVTDGEGIHIRNSIINTLDFDTLEFNNQVIIEKCIIENLLIHSCWFKKGLIFKNNLVMGYIDYQMGGHNKEAIIIDGNVFCEFLNFFDCHFENLFELKGNIFIKGSNLLGNVNEGFRNSFDIEIVLGNNIGNIYIDGLGR